MLIKEISLTEFEQFVQQNVIGNFYQSINYAMLKAEEGYDYEFIGLIDNNDLIAASLILYKKIGSYYYGYSPRGFLIDYSNYYLLNEFTKLIKEYYKSRNFAFIKINPEVAIAKLNKKTQNFEYNDNYITVNNLIRCGYKKLKDNMYFEALLPRINAILNLKTFDINTFNKNTRNKIKKAIRKGLTLELADQSKIPILYNLIKNYSDKSEFYLNNLYNVFNKNNSLDFFLVKVNFKEFLINSQNYYNYEYEKNSYLNNKIIVNRSSEAINAKMNSDKALLSYKNDIAEASKYLNSEETLYVAGAMVVKYDNRVSIKICGFDHNLKRYSSNYYLYFAILNYYQNKFSYADLDGITADLSKEGKYYGLNRFKLGFNPDIYEYIGEFDLIINESAYNYLQKFGLLAKELNK